MANQKMTQYDINSVGLTIGSIYGSANNGLISVKVSYDDAKIMTAERFMGGTAIKNNMTNAISGTVEVGVQSFKLENYRKTQVSGAKENNVALFKSANINIRGACSDSGKYITTNGMQSVVNPPAEQINMTMGEATTTKVYSISFSVSPYGSLTSEI